MVFTRSEKAGSMTMHVAGSSIDEDPDTIFTLAFLVPTCCDFVLVTSLDGSADNNTAEAGYCNGGGIRDKGDERRELEVQAAIRSQLDDGSAWRGIKADRKRVQRDGSLGWDGFIASRH